MKETKIFLLNAFKDSIVGARYYPHQFLMKNYFQLLRSYAYASFALKMTRNVKLNIVHAHFAYPEGFVGTLVKRALKNPLVITLHGYDILTEPDVGYGIRLRKSYDILVKEILNKSDAIIVASKAVYKETCGLVKDTGKVYLIPNAVDVKKFNPNVNLKNIRQRYGAEDKFIVFTIRHHEPVYGIVYLIMAAKLVVNYRKDILFIIGGDGSLRKYHEQLARKLDIKNNVIFTGRIPRVELPYYYAASDVVVVPSLQEAWSLVVTEAMASGKPVIGTNVGGIPDQIIDGYNGFLVPPRNPKSIAEKILWLYENQDQTKKMGMCGRKLVEEKFDINKRIDKILKLYKQLYVSS